MIDSQACRDIFKEAGRIEVSGSHSGAASSSGEAASGKLGGEGKDAAGLTREEVFDLAVESGFSKESVREALRRWENGLIQKKRRREEQKAATLSLFGGIIEAKRYPEEKRERLLRDVWWKQHVRSQHGETTRRPERPLTSGRMRKNRNKIAAMGGVMLLATIVAGAGGLFGGWVAVAGLLMCVGISAKVYRAEKLACELEIESVEEKHADFVRNHR